MIFDNTPPFVMSRNGLILATNELQTVYGSYMSLGPRGLCSNSAYYFPVSNSIDYTMIRIRNYMRIRSLADMVRLISVKIDKAKSRKTIDKYHAIIERIKICCLIICDTMDIDSEPTDLFTRLTVGGLIQAGTIKYKRNGPTYFGVPDIGVEESFNVLPIGIGTEWVSAIHCEYSIQLEAAMRSTSTNEELLMLLRKTGAIKVGEWLTVKQFMQRNKIIDLFRTIDEELMKDIESITTEGKEPGVY